MDDLVALVAKKTGLSKTKARAAVETVLGFFAERLPEPIAAQLEAFINGESKPKPTGILGQLGELTGLIEEEKPKPKKKKTSSSSSTKPKKKTSSSSTKPKKTTSSTKPKKKPASEPADESSDSLLD